MGLHTRRHPLNPKSQTRETHPFRRRRAQTGGTRPSPPDCRTRAGFADAARAPARTARTDPALGSGPPRANSGGRKHSTDEASSGASKPRDGSARSEKRQPRSSRGQGVSGDGLAIVRLVRKHSFCYSAAHRRPSRACFDHSFAGALHSEAQDSQIAPSYTAILWQLFGSFAEEI